MPLLHHALHCVSIDKVGSTRDRFVPKIDVQLVRSTVTVRRSKQMNTTDAANFSEIC